MAGVVHEQSRLATLPCRELSVRTVRLVKDDRQRSATPAQGGDGNTEQGNRTANDGRLGWQLIQKQP